MTTFPDKSELFNPDISGGDAKDLMEQWFDKTVETYNKIPAIVNSPLNIWLDPINGNNNNSGLAISSALKDLDGLCKLLERIENKGDCEFLVNIGPGSLAGKDFYLSGLNRTKVSLLGSGVNSTIFLSRVAAFCSEIFVKNCELPSIGAYDGGILSYDNILLKNGTGSAIDARRDGTIYHSGKVQVDGAYNSLINLTESGNFISALSTSSSENEIIFGANASFAIACISVNRWGKCEFGAPTITGTFTGKKYNFYYGGLVNSIPPFSWDSLPGTIAGTMNKNNSGAIGIFQGVPQTQVKFAGATAAISHVFGPIQSVTREGAGAYLISLLTPFNNSTLMVYASGQASAPIRSSWEAVTGSTVRVKFTGSSDTPLDPTTAMITIYW